MPDKKSDQSVFEKTYHSYLVQVFREIHDLSADRLGILIRNNEISVNLLNRCYTVSGNLEKLNKSCVLAGGISQQEHFSQDISMLFKILPGVPVLLLFNDEDEEFPASCSVLFEHRAENFIDAECLAMAGRFLFESIFTVG